MKLICIYAIALALMALGTNWSSIDWRTALRFYTMGVMTMGFLDTLLKR